MSDRLREAEAEPADSDRPAAVPDAVAPDGTSAGTGWAGRARSVLEYVTFGFGTYHLLKVVVFQFAILFLDVGLVDYVQRDVTPARRLFVTVMWLVAAFAFVAVLVALVRQMGRRTLAPRFRRPLHLAGSVCGYVVASGLSFGFGYVTLVLPGSAGRALSPSDLLPGGLLTLVFATFIAIGYHARVDAADHPQADDITDATVGWLDALSWPEREPNSLARERAYEQFVARSDELADVLAHARTVEGRRLAADFRAWRERFEVRSMLSRELIVRGGRGEGRLASERLNAEHEAFVSLRSRIEEVGGVADG